VLVKIPQKVIQNACGLAIFSTMRTGLWVSGSGGSGVLIARLPDGSWSPPSGILIHTVGVGFMAGIDIYDCVLVINSPKALEAFKKLRVTLGAEVSVAAGPVGIGGILDSNVDLRKERDHTPVFTYMKSRGLYAGVQVDGTFIIERNDENAKYYGERLGVNDILAGKVRHVPDSARPLIEIIRSAEGKTDVNRQFLNHVWEMPPPSEVDVEKNAEATHEQKTAYGPAYGSDVKYA
jgi:lipid-binding SYLF domain-containing protein